MNTPKTQTKNRKRSTVLTILAVLLSLSLSSLHPGARASDTQAASPNLWVVKEGKHTSLILRTQDTTERLPLAEAKLTSGHFVMISWGDAAYYQTADKTIALTLKAMLLPTQAALNARSLSVLEEAPQTREEAKLYPVTLSPEALDNVLTRIAFTLESGGVESEQAVLVGVSNDYVGGAFYPASDRRYSLLFTCNSWVADVLKSGGLRFSKLSAQTATNLVLQHKLHWLLSSKYRAQTQFSSITVKGAP